MILTTFCSLLAEQSMMMGISQGSPGQRAIKWLCVCVCVRACCVCACVTHGFLGLFTDTSEHILFYRVMLCIRSTSHGPVSVRLSVTSRCSTKTAKHRITQSTPHESPGTLVFLCQRSPRNSTRITPFGGAKCRWGGSKLATFDK